MNVSWNVLNGLIEDLYAQRDAAEADAARLAEALQRVVALRFSRDLHANSSAMASADAALDAHRERTEGHG